MIGKTTWLIADGFMSNTKTEHYVSHEAVCVLNVGQVPAHIKLTIYFEDRDPMTGFTAQCPPQRTNHIRLDRLKNDRGEEIPRETPYAVLVESDVPVVCQHSRMDVSDPNMTLMTTIPYAETV